MSVMDICCQGRPGCNNKGEVEFTATGNIGDSEEEETIHALLCADCAKEALRIAAEKIG